MGMRHFDYWVYVPAQYTPSDTASLMIFNDGQAFKTPTGNISGGTRPTEPAKN